MGRVQVGGRGRCTVACPVVGSDEGSSNGGAGSSVRRSARSARTALGARRQEQERQALAKPKKGAGWRANEREFCDAATRAGDPCSLSAGWGTDHPGFGCCRKHGGNTNLHRRSAALAQAAKSAERFGLPIDVDPHEALLEELARTNGHVAWLRLQVAALESDTVLHGPVGTEGTTESGLTAHPRAEPHIWVQMYRHEREHLAKVAKLCIDAGIEERRVRVAEAQGQLMAKALQSILGGIGALIGQDLMALPEVPGIVRQGLLAADVVEGDAVEVEVAVG